MSCTRYNFPIINYMTCGCPTSGTGAEGPPGPPGVTTVITTAIEEFTLAELRAVNPIPDGLKSATLYGINAKGDSAAIHYYWDADSLDADDGIMTIKFDVTDSGDPGRLKQEGSSAP